MITTPPGRGASPRRPLLKPLLKWPGGKTRLLKHLLPLIPPHQCYCEPFAGGLALLLANPGIKNVARIAKALGIKTTALLEGVEA